MQGVFHRALNMSNLLIEPQQTGPAVLKVSDFAYSKNALLDSRPKTMIGDFAYTCPELLLGLRTEDGQDTGRGADIWVRPYGTAGPCMQARFASALNAMKRRHALCSGLTAHWLCTAEAACFGRIGIGGSIIEAGQCTDDCKSYLGSGFAGAGMWSHPLLHACWEAAVQGGLLPKAPPSSLVLSLPASICPCQCQAGLQHRSKFCDGLCTSAQHSSQHAWSWPRVVWELHCLSATCTSW